MRRQCDSRCGPSSRADARFRSSGGLRGGVRGDRGIARDKGGSRAGGGETGASFVCFTTADQKTFTVPASILSQLQPVSAAAESNNTGSGSLNIFSTTSTTFTATRVADGSSIPSTFSGLTGSEASSVVYQ